MANINFQLRGTTDWLIEKHFDPCARMTIMDVGPFAVLLNGIDPNQKILTGRNAAVHALQIIPPRDEIYPGVNFAPNSEGKVFGESLKWRIRYKNGETNEVSGLSPIPAIGLNLGQESTDGADTYVGVQCLFDIEGTDDAQVDTIQLFRNSSYQDSIWWLVAEGENPGAGNYLTMADNMDYEDVFTKETAGLRLTAGYLEGRVPPVAKAYMHPSGRVWYYGLVHMGRSGGFGGLSATIDSMALTPSSGQLFQTKAREGQTLIAEAHSWTGGGFGFIWNTPNESCLILEIDEDNDTIYVTPEPNATVTIGSWFIQDNRDPRAVYMSEPQHPSEVDTLKTVYIGSTAAQPLYFLGGIRGTTFGITSHQLVRIDDDRSADPSVTLRQTIIADEGTVGLWSAAETPFGLVYLNRDLGVRMYTGEGLPIPLGGGGPQDFFRPRTQLYNMEPSQLENALLIYDAERNEVIVSYVPLGRESMTEQLVYSFTTRTWRGPWLSRINAAGTLVNNEKVHELIVGDDMGNLYEMKESGLDGLETSTGSTTTGSVTSVLNNVITDSGATFTDDIIGAPVMLDDGAGNLYLNYVALRTDVTSFQLAEQGDYTIAAGWTYSIGSIHWLLETGNLNGGEPILPKLLANVAIGYDAVGADDTFTVTAAANGGAFTAAETADVDTSVGDNDIYAEVRFRLGGRYFRLRFEGVAVDQDLRLVQVIAGLDVRSGR